MLTVAGISNAKWRAQLKRFNQCHFFTPSHALADYLLHIHCSICVIGCISPKSPQTIVNRIEIWYGGVQISSGKDNINQRIIDYILSSYCGQSFTVVSSGRRRKRRRRKGGGGGRGREGSWLLCRKIRICRFAGGEGCGSWFRTSQN